MTGMARPPAAQPCAPPPGPVPAPGGGRPGFPSGQVVYLPLTIRGKNGVVESNADEAVTLTVKGGELLGFGSANPCTTDRFDAGRCTTYQGCALAVVRLGEGPLTVTATGTSLPGATLTLTTI